MSFNLKNHSIGYKFLSDFISGPYPEFFLNKEETELKMYLPGFGKKNIIVQRNGNRLEITGSSKEMQSITGEQAAIDCAFMISDLTEVKSVDMTNGILTIKFEHFKVDKRINKYDVWENGIVPKVEEPKVEEDKKDLPEWKDNSLTFNENSNTISTVVVNVVDRINQVAELTLVEDKLIFADHPIHPKSHELTLELSDATKEFVNSPDLLSVVKTEKGKPDLIVGVDHHTLEVLSRSGNDVEKIIEETVKDFDLPTIEKSKDITSKTIEATIKDLKVEIPVILPQVVEVNIKDDVVTLVDVTTDVNEESSVTEVVTAENENNMIVSIPHIVKDEIYDKTGLSGDDFATKISNIIEDKQVKVEVVDDPNSVVLNSDTNSTPTVEVKVPKIIPSIIEVEVLKINENISKVDEKPQVVLNVKDASYEIESDSTVTSLLKTEDGRTDVVIAIEANNYQDLMKLEVNPIIEVSKAIEEKIERVEPVLEEISEEAKIKVESFNDEMKIEIPKELPSIVEMKVEDNKIVLHDARNDVSEHTALIPMITEAHADDVVLSIPSEAVDSLGMNVEEIASKVEEVLQNNVSEIEDVKFTQTFNENEIDAATVSVEVPITIPQIVELEVTVHENVPIDSKEEKVEIVLKDATTEIVSDDVTLNVVKTEEGKSDVVVAILNEDIEQLKSSNVNVTEIMNDFIKENKHLVVDSGTIEKETEVKIEVVDNVSFEIPNEVSSVVEVVVEDNKVALNDVSSNIPTENVELIPTVTATDEKDIVLVIKESTASELVKTPEKLAKVVEDLLQKNKTEVTTLV